MARFININKFSHFHSSSNRKIESTSEIYLHIPNFLQAYTWALDGMKFVSTLKMQDCTSLESCQEMIDKFDRYMESHPTLSDVRNYSTKSILGPVLMS